MESRLRAERFITTLLTGSHRKSMLARKTDLEIANLFMEKALYLVNNLLIQQQDAIDFKNNLLELINKFEI